MAIGMPTQDPRTHRFVSETHILHGKNLTAAMGLVGFYALGAGMMLAKTLIIVGFLMSLVASAGIMWLYFKPMRIAYISLAEGRKYYGPPPRELFIAFAIIATIIPIAFAMFVTSLKEYVTTTLARYQFNHLSFEKEPNSSLTFVNAVLINDGNLTAIDDIYSVGGALLDHPLSSENEKKLLALQLAIVKIGMRKGIVGPDIQPGKGNVETIFNIGYLSPKDIQDIKDTRKVLYFVSVSHYRDDALAEGVYWLSVQCGYYTGPSSYSHSCEGVPNRIKRVKYRHFGY
jgi:hypothetical protein